MYHSWYGMEEVMNREEFYNYILENYNVDGTTVGLIHNILIFVENNYPSEYDQQYNVLDELLGGTIGLTSDELKKACM